MAKDGFKDACIAYGSGILLGLAALYAPAALVGSTIGAAAYYLTRKDDDDDDDDASSGCIF